MRIDLADLARHGPGGDRWSFEDGRWRRGRSFIEPFFHAALSCSQDTTVAGARFVVRERRDSGDCLTVQVGRGRVRAEAGMLGVAPLYFAAADGVVHGSWDVTDLAQFATAESVSGRVVARLLTRRHRYSAETLFTTITRLTERAVITSDGHTVHTRYPGDAAHVVRARTLRADADPITGFEAALNEVIKPVVELHGSRVGVEVSGGRDSANVALSAATSSPRVLVSLGLLVGGPAGEHQRHRRDILTSILGLRDIAIPAVHHLPFGYGDREQIHDADGEVYREAFDALRGAARDAGLRVILTGFGGDEMLALRAEEHPVPRPAWHGVPDPPVWLTHTALDALIEVNTDIAPISAVAVPALMAAAARHPNYLTQGLWPIAPLAQPNLLRLGESLPVEWRVGKTLFARRLARAGFGPALTDPDQPETFTHAMTLAIRTHAPRLLRRMRERSFLADLGYLDPTRLPAVDERPHSRAVVPPLLYDTLAIEAGLRAMIDHQPVPVRDYA